MKLGLKQALLAFGSGLVFGMGLLVSGMTRPEKVIGFLDVFGRWDPTLALVMIGGIGVHSFAYVWLRRQKPPLAAEIFTLPSRGAIEPALVGGAALFGIGWGLSGYCPGPSIVALASARSEVFVFVACVLLGSLLASRVEGALAARPAFRASPLPPRP